MPLRFSGRMHGLHALDNLLPFGGGQRALGFGAPGLRPPRPPISEGTRWYAIHVQYVPARTIAALPVRNETMQRTVWIDVIRNRKAGGRNR